MGKHVLAAVALCLVWVGSSAPVAQDKPRAGAGREYPFAPGKYFTADEYEHVSAALGYVDLKPADLSFEKKVALNQRFVLPVCAQCLDNPLSVPKVAEEAAETFERASHGSARAKRAAELIGLGIERFSHEELLKDAESWKDLSKANENLVAYEQKWRNDGKRTKDLDGDAEHKRLVEAYRKAEKDLALDAKTRLFGGEARIVQNVDTSSAIWSSKTLDGNFELMFLPALFSMVRDADPKDLGDRQSVAAQLPGNFAESDTVRLPGAANGTLEGDAFLPASHVLKIGTFVCAARMAGILDD